MASPLIDRLYTLLYGGLLSRLPEARAVRLGQALLRLLPVEGIPAFRREDPRLAVTLGGVRLPNPVILSSMYYDLRILGKAMALGFGAVTTKSITPAPRPGHPEPTLVRRSSALGPGFVNCNGFKNPGLAAYRDALAGFRRTRPLIVSVAGESVEEYRAMVEGLERYADLVEVNISSPNTRLVYQLSASPERVRGLLKEVRATTTRPLVVKLSPDYLEENFRAIVPAALEVGVEAVNFGNTRRVEEPGLSQGAGGLSGPELFETVLETVRRLRETFGQGFGLIATGGIDSPAKALRALEAGADAVGYFTGFVTRGPGLARRILDALLETVDHRGLPGVSALRAAH